MNLLKIIKINIIIQKVLVFVKIILLVYNRNDLPILMKLKT